MVFKCFIPWLKQIWILVHSTAGFLLLQLINNRRFARCFDFCIPNKTANKSREFEFNNFAAFRLKNKPSLALIGLRIEPQPIKRAPEAWLMLHEPVPTSLDSIWKISFFSQIVSNTSSLNSLKFLYFRQCILWLTCHCWHFKGQLGFSFLWLGFRFKGYCLVLLFGARVTSKPYLSRVNAESKKR